MPYPSIAVERAMKIQEVICRALAGTLTRLQPADILEKRSPGNAVEEELFQGIRQSFSSLFRVETVRGDGVVLRDLLTPSQDPHTLVDLGLIHTGRSGLLLFTRLLPLRGYAVTGGVSFAFPGEHEDLLINEDRQLRKRARPAELSMRRYMLFHRLSKSIGLPMQFDEPPPQA